LGHGQQLAALYKLHLRLARRQQLYQSTWPSASPSVGAPQLEIVMYKNQQAPHSLFFSQNKHFKSDLISDQHSSYTHCVRLRVPRIDPIPRASSEAAQLPHPLASQNSTPSTDFHKMKNTRTKAKGQHLCERCYSAMEKLGVEPRTFSTQHLGWTPSLLRRCHTARPYPLIE
jgi:hypothetical protein